MNCNTANVVGQQHEQREHNPVRDFACECPVGVMCRLRSDANGAIMIIVAVFAGAGVLLAVLAMGIETGRVYMMRSQVQSAGDSTILALAQQCKNNVLGVTTRCTTATSLYSLAKTSASAISTGQNAITLVGVCVDTGTATSVQCSTSSAGPDNSVPDTLDDRCAALPSGTDRYVQVIVERSSAFSGLFMPNTKFRQCVQAKWSIGTSQLTPMPFVFPACAFTTSGNYVLILENPSQGGGTGSRNGQNCTATWAAGATQTFTYAPTTVSSVDPADPAYLGKVCGDNVTISLGSVLTMGELIQATCPQSVSSLDTWRNSSSNARWVPIAGDYLTDSWNVTVVAFAKFDLWAYNPANDDDWKTRSGFSLPSSISSSCQSPKKLTCVYGRWVSGTLQYAGNSSTVDGIELLQ